MKRKREREKGTGQREQAIHCRFIPSCAFLSHSLSFSLSLNACDFFSVSPENQKSPTLSLSLSQLVPYFITYFLACFVGLGGESERERETERTGESFFSFFLFFLLSKLNKINLTLVARGFGPGLALAVVFLAAAAGSIS